MVPDFSVIFLSMCAHNPTGQDLNMDEWKTLADALKVSQTLHFLVAYNIVEYLRTGTELPSVDNQTHF